ncbi:MAG TPA: ROK family transcriptional regulator, partial [Bryobacteraceae bacterium]|nr:ROK family transcriptional regulator [Bryobacteraceae bacterium]
MSLTSRSALRKSDLREANERLLLSIIRQDLGTSRADIVRITGFSPSSVTFIVNRMIRDGLLSETPSEGQARVGRRPLILRLQPKALMAVGVEIARSETRVAIAGLDGKIINQRTVSWQPDQHVFLARVREAIRALVGNVPSNRLLGVGVSVSGTIDHATGRVVAAEHLGWFEVDIGPILSAGIPASFYIENDAKLRALAELWFCEPGSRPLENFVFLALRHGLGTGVVIEGRLFHGAFGEAVEFGHTSLYPDGRRCVCGGVGCWEEYASQEALERLYAERRGAASHAPEQSAEAILRLARNGDPIALDVLRETATYVGMGFANLNATFNPEAIVVSDYLASGWDLMKDWVWGTLRSRAAHRYLSRLRIIPSRHRSDSALK